WSWAHAAAIGFSDPSGVRRFDGKPILLANIQTGAMAVDFQAFRYVDGAMHPASPIIGMKVGPTFEDINRDGHLELLAARYRPPYSDLDDVYYWDGTQFVCSDAQYPDHYASMLSAIASDARSRRPVDVFTRLSKVAEAMEIDLYTKRFNDGVDLANWALAAFDDGSLTQPFGMAASERGNAKAIVYYLEGMIYQGEAEVEKAADAFARSRRSISPGSDLQALLQDWFPPRRNCSVLDPDFISAPPADSATAVSSSALTAPKPISPPDGVTLRGFPRTTTLQWAT